MKNVLRGMLYPVGPIFQIEIDFQPDFFRFLNSLFDIFDVFLYRFLKLEGTMFFLSFAEQIHHFGSTRTNPFDRSSFIEKSQYLDFVDVSSFLGPFA